jgi:hypothetical protein
MGVAWIFGPAVGASLISTVGATYLVLAAILSVTVIVALLTKSLRSEF